MRRLILPILILSFACGVSAERSSSESFAQGTTPGPTPPPTYPSPPFQAAPIYTIRIHGIATSDFDGSNASTVTAATITSLMPEVNEIFATAGIAIAFDPTNDFETIQSTLLNQRFGISGNIASYTDPNTPPTMITTAYDTARRNQADLHRSKITIFFARPLKLAFNASLGHWTLVERVGRRLVQRAGALGQLEEWGGRTPASPMRSGTISIRCIRSPAGSPNVSDAANAIECYVNGGHPQSEGLLALDGDRAYVLDTPPDAPGSIFESVYGAGTKCGPNGTVVIPVNFGNGTSQPYTLAPDRQLVMSYFKGCFDGDHFSPQQSIRICDGLESLNRRTSSRFRRRARRDRWSSRASTTAGIHRLTSPPHASDAGGWSPRRPDPPRSSSSYGTSPRPASSPGGATSTVGDVSGGFAVTHGGLNQVLVVYPEHRGNLVVKSYQVGSSGTPALEDTYTSGAVSQVSIVRVDRITFATPIRLNDGTLRVIRFRIYADGDHHPPRPRRWAKHLLTRLRQLHARER